MPEGKDIIEWCIVLGALIFGAFGFLYSVYATAQLEDEPPPIVEVLRTECRILSIILVVLTALAAATNVHVQSDLLSWSSVGTWIIVLCFVLVTGCSFHLAFNKMR